MDSQQQNSLNSILFESFTHTNNVLKGLNELRLKDCLFDITLIAGDQEFHAHRALLASCSDYFRAMLTGNGWKEGNLEKEISLNVSPEGISLILDYIYTSKLQLNLANVQHVLAAASYTQLDSVVEACLNYLQSQVDIDNCIDILTISETYSLSSLQQKVYRFICGHLNEVSKTNEFHRLSIAQLEQILACDFPVDCGEADVLKAVLLWITKSDAGDAEMIPTRPAITQAASQLLKHIRFNEISLTSVKHALSSFALAPTSALYKQVQEMARAERKKLKNNTLYTHSLVNLRGMELALIKIGGFDLSGITNEITYCFPNSAQPETAAVWRYLTSIPHIKQSNFGTAVLNNQLYVVGGCYDISLEEYIHPFGFRYCPISNQWQTIAPMNVDRCRFSLNVVGNNLIAIGGVSEMSGEDGGGGLLGAAADSTYSSGERYDATTDRWEFIAPIVEYRSQHAATSVDRYLYISGGLDSYGAVLNSFWKYNSTYNYWTKLPNMLSPRADHVILHINSKLYVCGGWYESGTSRQLCSTIDVFNYATNTWSVVTQIPTPKYHAGIVALNNRIYIIGGFCSDDIFRHTASTIEMYDIDKNLWSKQKNYPKNIWEHSGAILYIPKCREDMEVIIQE